MKPVKDIEVAAGLARLQPAVIKWFEDSLQEQLVSNMTLVDPQNGWGQGRAQELAEICQSIRNAKSTVEKLSQ